MIMKKKFIVCINDSNREQDKKFIEFLRAHGLGWWHYLKNTWLIVDSSGEKSVNEIRDIAKDSFDKAYNLVFQLNEDEGTWSGFGPSSDKRNMFKWIKENWN